MEVMRLTVAQHEQSNLAALDLGQELTAGFAGRYVRFKARQLIGHYGYVATDQPDLEQELRLRLVQRARHFDSRRGPWNSFVVAVVDRQVATILRPRRRMIRCQSLSLLTAHGPSEPDDAEGSDHRDDCRRPSGARPDRRELDLAELRLDIAVIAPRLPATYESSGSG